MMIYKNKIQKMKKDKKTGKCEIQYKCIRCEGNFINKIDIERHLLKKKKCASIDPYFNISEDEVYIRSLKRLNCDEKNTKNYEFQCEDCLKKYKTIYILKKHKLTCKKVIDLNYLNDNEIKNIIKNNDEKNIGIEQLSDEIWKTKEKNEKNKDNFTQRFGEYFNINPNYFDEKINFSSFLDLKISEKIDNNIISSDFENKKLDSDINNDSTNKNFKESKKTINIINNQNNNIIEQNLNLDQSLKINLDNFNNLENNITLTDKLRSFNEEYDLSHFDSYKKLKYGFCKVFTFLIKDILRNNKNLNIIPKNNKYSYIFINKERRIILNDILVKKVIEKVVNLKNELLKTQYYVNFIPQEVIDFCIDLNINNKEKIYNSQFHNEIMEIFKKSISFADIDELKKLYNIDKKEIDDIKDLMKYFNLEETKMINNFYFDYELKNLDDKEKVNNIIEDKFICYHKNDFFQMKDIWEK